MIRVAKRAERDTEPLMERQKKSLSIAKNALELQLLSKARTIFSYLPTQSEVDTHPILWELPGATILVPKMIDDKIVACIKKDLVPGYLGIEEPRECEQIPLDEIDVVLIPGIAFDEKGNRIGRGMGHFDRFLKKVECPIIGLAFEFQIVEKIPTDSYDVPVDMIVTERRIIDCTH